MDSNAEPVPGPSRARHSSSSSTSFTSSPSPSDVDDSSPNLVRISPQISSPGKLGRVRKATKTPGGERPPKKTRKNTPIRMNRLSRNRVNERRQINFQSGQEVEDNSSLSEDDSDVPTPSRRRRETESVVPPFSIHRLIPKDLRKRPGFEKEKSVEDLVECVMKEINDLKQHKARPFIKKTPGTPFQAESPIEIEPPLHGFGTLAYVLKIPGRDALLNAVGIEGCFSQISKILFFFRSVKPEEIFAITTGQTWRAIQEYSCPLFPIIMEQELTKRGNLRQKLKPVTGINWMTTASKKSETSFDPLTNVRVNETKEILPDASIYELNAFKPEVDDTPRKRGNDKITIQVRCIRFEKRLVMNDIPELFHHFSEICQRASIFTIPFHRPMSSGEVEKANKKLYEMVFNFLRNPSDSNILQFELVDSAVEEYSLATGFKLIYSGKVIGEYSNCPTTLQVMTNLRKSKILNECRNGTQDEERIYHNRLKNYVDLEYVSRGKPESKKLVRLLEGELEYKNGTCWKAMGTWFHIEDDFHWCLHTRWLEILRDNVLRSGDPGSLPNVWKKVSITDYVATYRNDLGYYFPPPSRNSRKNLDSCSYLRKEHWFDMIKFQRNENGTISTYLYYIFDRFNPTIRNASTRVAKSIEDLFQEPVVDRRSEGTGNSRVREVSLLQKFYNYHQNASTTFRLLFPEFSEFSQAMLGKSRVTVVIGLPTGKAVEMSSLEHVEEEQDGITRVGSLAHESKLLETFTVANLREYVVSNFDEHCRNSIPMPEVVSGGKEVDPEEALAKTLLTRLQRKGYCTTPINSGADLEGDALEFPEENAITGKLLKLRSSKSFKIFDDSRLNQRIFELIKINFVTHFPGIVHKLECMEIRDVVEKKNWNLKFAEIKMDQ